MQTGESYRAKQIEGVLERILQCAKEEFLKNGYKDTSLRVIAAAAGVLLGMLPYFAAA
ncbi:MAG TPA: TetR family transcriptional regulator [Candidatus Anaerobutyricum faecale]|nr:TetR family transcriptional regulator [Candidatus Anaerobutyricum faecale]